MCGAAAGRAASVAAAASAQYKYEARARAAAGHVAASLPAKIDHCLAQDTPTEQIKHHIKRPIVKLPVYSVTSGKVTSVRQTRSLIYSGCKTANDSLILLFLCLPFTRLSTT